MNKPRLAIGGLALSAAALVALVTHEGWAPVAMIPIPGDRVTVGFGSTFNLDGTPVKMGDVTTPVKALARALVDAQKFEGALKTCVKAPLHQHEYDAFLSLSYNIGSTAFCSSTLVRKLNTGDYQGACDAVLMWDKVGGKPIRGLTVRRVRERDQCLGKHL